MSKPFISDAEIKAILARLDEGRSAKSFDEPTPAAIIRASLSRIRQLEEALKPFATEAKRRLGGPTSRWVIGSTSCALTLQDYRRVLSVLPD